jgi:pSer/pThr/pTyr-binding forkhead associated (FHA) protein
MGGMGGPVAAPGMGGNTLHIIYQGQRYPVTKDRFIVGRGKQSSDMTIKDPNVSRQHAMVELTAEGAAIVDLDSTNGVEFNGERVKRRTIQNGDLYILCGHELRFEYQWSQG